MILALLAAAGIAAADPPPPVQPLGEAAHAIEAGRLDQARTMIANAVKSGAGGEAVDRLLADLAFASGDHQTALARYQVLLVTHKDDLRLYERAGLAAVNVGDMTQGRRLLQRATGAPTASWRAWNALGVTADYQRDWAAADEAYEQAAALAPDRAEVLNNMGWSLLVRGRWNEALAPLERAIALDPKSERASHNLELARAAVSENLPERRAGESDEAWAARLNDAGVVARIRGDNRKAVAAFSRAIEARSEWFERAANNLAMAERAR